MRIPEFLFCVLNPMMRMTLHSPAHFVFSDSIVVIKYTGRKSGKSYEVPVRYVEKNRELQCYTDKRAGWWPNLRDNPSVTFRLRGRDIKYATRVLIDDPEKLRAELIEYLNKYPEDAVYHDVRLDANGKPLESDIDLSAPNAVVIYATPSET